MSTTIALVDVDEDSLSGAPAPFVDILVDVDDAGVATATVWRTVRGRSTKVRGLVNVAATSAVTTRDFEAPFGVEVSYRVQQFDASGDFISYSTPATITPAMPEEGYGWIHNCLDPSSAVRVQFAGSAGARITRPLDSEVYRIPGRTVGVALSRGRRGVEQLAIDCITQTVEDAERFDALFGGYDDDTTPILCVRSRPEMLFPQPLYALVSAPAYVPINNRIGREDARWLMNADEVAPPPSAIVAALLTYADFTAFYSTYVAFSAAYADYTEASRDYTIAGTA